MEESFGKVIASLEGDAGKAIFRWRNRIRIRLEKAVKSERESGNRSLILDPLSSPIIDGATFSSSLSAILLPVILSERMRTLLYRLNDEFLADRIIGFSHFNLHDSPGIGLTYLKEVIAFIFPLRDYKIFAHDYLIDVRYYLPSLYRYLEETPIPPPLTFELEKSIVKFIRDDIPIDTYVFTDHRPPWGECHRALVSIKEKDLPKIGVSAALLTLGREPSKLLLPIEFGVTDGPSADLLIRRTLSSINGGKLEIRTFPYASPGGDWYLGVRQYLLDGRIVALLHNLPYYTSHGVDKSGRLSPYIILASLCYNAWLVERRGGDRVKWLNSLIRHYREKVIREKEMGEYDVIGEVVPWRTHYLRQITWGDGQSRE